MFLQFSLQPMKTRTTLSPEVEDNGRRPVCFNWSIRHCRHENVQQESTRVLQSGKPYGTAPHRTRLIGGLLAQGFLALGMMLWSLSAFGANQRRPEPVSQPAVLTPGSRSGRRSLCEPWRAQIEAAVTLGLSAIRIHQDLVVLPRLHCSASGDGGGKTRPTTR